MSLADDAVAVCLYSANPIAGRHGDDCTTGALELEDRLTEDASGFQVRERVRVWRVPTHELPSVARHSTVVLTESTGDVSYRVREAELANGGSILELTLVPA